MCVQYKQCYELCPHVAYDYNVEDCKLAARGRPCTFQATRIPKGIWAGTMYEGKCHFCEQEEDDAKEAKRKEKRVARRLDLFEEIVLKSDGIVASQESNEMDKIDAIIKGNMNRL